MRCVGLNHDQRKVELGQIELWQNKLEITANSPEVGEAKETIAINYKGPDMP